MQNLAFQKQRTPLRVIETPQSELSSIEGTPRNELFLPRFKTNESATATKTGKMMVVSL
jgi:hypothetical protein